jgi:hypothetical protein
VRRELRGVTSPPPFDISFYRDAYGVAVGEADSLAEGDASAFFFVVVFLAGDDSVEAEAELFFVVEEVPFLVDLVVVAADVVVAASSFF